jgi:hypothetical protein
MRQKEQPSHVEYWLQQSRLWVRGTFFRQSDYLFTGGALTRDLD